MEKQSKNTIPSEMLKRWNKMLFSEALNELLDYYGYRRYYDKSKNIHSVEFILKDDKNE